jgi:polyphosphate kinase 2 (PPK2 family)
VWKARFGQINNFEETLVSAGTVILKFYLHISKEEQEERLLAREKDPTKSWKLSVGDWKERELWDDYTAAYEDAIEKCSTEDAPWRIIPANHKWFRDLAIAQAIVQALEPLEKGWREHLEEVGKEEKALLAAFKKGGEPSA